MNPVSLTVFIAQPLCSVHVTLKFHTAHLGLLIIYVAFQAETLTSINPPTQTHTHTHTHAHTHTRTILSHFMCWKLWSWQREKKGKLPHEITSVYIIWSLSNQNHPSPVDQFFSIVLAHFSSSFKMLLHVCKR